MVGDQADHTALVQPGHDEDDIVVKVLLVLLVLHPPGQQTLLLGDTGQPHILHSL